MEKANLQKLRIYELAELLAGHVWGIVWAGVDSQGRRWGQLVEAADSVGANIAEVTGRESLQDIRPHARIARGSFRRCSTGSAAPTSGGC